MRRDRRPVFVGDGGPGDEQDHECGLLEGVG
jgi:hypothetical protein